LIEHDGEDVRGRSFLDRKAALARLLRDQGWHPAQRHVAGDGPTVFKHAFQLGAEGIVSKRADVPSVRLPRGVTNGVTRPWKMLWQCQGVELDLGSSCRSSPPTPGKKLQRSQQAQRRLPRAAPSDQLFC
jgi:hypothetical protein